MNGKNPITSKTLWLNVAGILTAVAGAVNPKTGMILLAVGNVITRLMTSQPIDIPGLRE